MKRDCNLKESIPLNPEMGLEQLNNRRASICRKIELANNEAQAEYHMKQLPRIDAQRLIISKSIEVNYATIH